MNPSGYKKTMNIFTYLWNIYVQFVFFIMTYYNVHHSSKVTTEPIKYVMNETELFIDAKHKKFINSFLDKTNETKLNANIDVAFYSKPDLHEKLQYANNTIESDWKRRILFESTPRGNIVMYYDAYKQGFAYYSDTACIPNTLLNSIAMKYVMVYLCRDFFVDDQITPVYSPSPMIKIHYSPDKPVIIDEAKKSAHTNDFKNAPFAKFKNYTKIKNNDMDNQMNPDKKTEYNRNKFISLGKISNFKFLQSNSNKNNSSMNGFSSKLLDNLSGETQLQKQVLSYKNYKNQKTIL